jgi:hypothetical protein
MGHESLNCPLPNVGKPSIEITLREFGRWEDVEQGGGEILQIWLFESFLFSLDQNNQRDVRKY